MLVKTTKESQIKRELHVNKLQESVDIFSAKFDEFDKEKKGKKTKNKKFRKQKFKNIWQKNYFRETN